MRFSRPILYGLSLPAGLAGYFAGAWVLEALPVPGLSGGLLGVFVPLLISGLFMLPFVIPFLDQKAKHDLAAHRAAVAAAGEGRRRPDVDGAPGDIRPGQARPSGPRRAQRRGGGRGARR